MLSASEKLIRAIFDEDPSAYADYPYLNADAAIESAIQEALRTLYPRELRILKLRFGFADGKPKTLAAIGKEFNVLCERIRQIEAKALRKLRHPARSRKFACFLYKPTPDDKRACAMRERLCAELLRFYPEHLAYNITMGLKRPYLKRALRDLTRGNVGRAVRLSCGLPMQFCKNCGVVTLPNWDFCSKECQKAYKRVTLICDECGTSFPRLASTVIHRLGKLSYQHCFCSKHCGGKYLGKHCGGRKKKGAIE